MDISVNKIIKSKDLDDKPIDIFDWKSLVLYSIIQYTILSDCLITYWFADIKFPISLALF